MRLAQYRRAVKLPRHGFHGWTNKRRSGSKAIDVSVVVTCYNYERYLERTLQSVFAAAAPTLSVEVVMVDDDSSDTSLSVARRILRNAPIPMRVLHNWWNVGVSQSRNMGLGQSTGEFVFILDADNTIEPGALVNLVDCAQRAKADAAYGPIRRVTPEGLELEAVSDRPFDPEFLIHQGNYIDAMALFRRTSLLAIGGYDVELLPLIGGWEDYAVWLEFIRRRYRVAFRPRTVGRYLVKPDSMLRQITEDEQMRALQFLRSRYREFAPPVSGG